MPNTGVSIQCCTVCAVARMLLCCHTAGPPTLEFGQLWRRMQQSHAMGKAICTKSIVKLQVVGANPICPTLSSASSWVTSTAAVGRTAASADQHALASAV